MHGYLIHYGELSLKGENRPFFERTLLENIRHQLKNTGIEKVTLHRLYGRFFLELPETEEVRGPVADTLQHIFGITSFSTAQMVKASVQDLPLIIWKSLKGKSFRSFAVRASRADKSLPFSSRDLEFAVGGYIKDQSGATVDLSNPELTCYLEALSESFIFYSEKIPGPGGLPVGTSGKLVALLSGGIDSPVAAWRMLRRGAPCVFVHFHSYPHTDAASQNKVRELAKLLARWQTRTRLYLVPLLEIQKAVVAQGPEKLRVILYRRAMVRLSENIAKREGAKGLVTGESLGQVASQTVENLAAISQATALPILRSLIGMDKQEIITEAKQIGTYELSTQPFVDCCSLFVPKHPETKASLEMLEAAEKQLELEKVEQAALANTQTELF